MIDIHTHLWSEEQCPEYLKEYFAARKLQGENIELTAGNLLEKMERSGIEKSIVSALCFYPNMSEEDVEQINAYVLQQAKMSEGRIRAFCTVNPFSRTALDQIERYMGEVEFQGLKLHPNMQEFYPDDESIFAIYQMMQEYQKPVLFHSGGIGVRPIRDCYSELIRFDTVACEFPEMPMILGHAGRIDYVTTSTLLRKHSNIYADISTNFGRIQGKEWIPFLDLLIKVKSWSGTVDKLMFGSDYPFYTQEDTIRMIEDAVNGLRYYPMLSETDINDVLRNNAEVFAEKYKIFK